MDQLDRRILNIVQSAFPVVEQPFREIGEQVGLAESEVLGRLERLKERHILRQISAIFDTRRLGYRSSLVAMRFPAERLPEAARRVNERPGVSHNYEREGYFNLWFTIAVHPSRDLNDVVEGMGRETEAEAVRLMPTIRFFKIGVNFDMEAGKGASHQFSPDGYGAADPSGAGSGERVSQRDVELIRELQEDLELVPRPFDGMARRLGITTPELFACAEELGRRGLMRRYSAVLHHRRAGFTANAMVVWRVPEERAEEVGRRMAAHPAVSHCYQRPTFPDWPYTHFSMIHATGRQECEEIAREISGDTGVSDYRLLYSTREFKKTRVRYFVEYEYEGREGARV